MEDRIEFDSVITEKALNDFKMYHVFHNVGGVFGYVFAAFAIVMISSAVPVVSLSAFAGAFITLIITLLIAYVVPGKSSYNIVLSGIAIHSLAQTFLKSLCIIVPGKTR